MLKRFIYLLIAAAAFAFSNSAQFSHAGDLMVGCCTRPACGKVCQLVCKTKKITAVCYGCECKDICLPGPSRQGCKHCATCCGEGECPASECCAVCDGSAGNCRANCQAMEPKCEFCWYDWFACGCARPRTVKVLTKYQAEKEIPWYHWEVVDAACCEPATKSSPAADSTSRPPRLFKPAPPESQVGDTLELSEEEQNQLASWMTDQLDRAVPAEPSDAPSEQKEGSPHIARKFADLFGLGEK